jgi:hypothetical protein
MDGEGKNEGSLNDLKPWLPVLATIPAPGLIAIIAYGLQFSPAEFASVLGVGLIIGAAALAVGGFLGFLFGIPRAAISQGSAQEEQPGGGQVSGKGEESGSRPAYTANTNLEQISDWLTKILVGVGLTQIPAIGEAAGRLIANAGDALGGGQGSQMLAAALLSYFLVSGFLASYLVTRTRLTLTFTLSDIQVLGARVARAEKLSESAQNQSQSLARGLQALGLVDRLIAVDPDDPSTPTPTADELLASFQGARPSTLAQIYWRARDFRAQTWRTDKARMSRAIPIFRALVAQDTDNRFHQNHGELGFALKDQDPPAWDEAEAELTEAIRIRDAAGDQDISYFRFYDFNRALCRIARDPTRRGTSAVTAEPLREEVLNDLRAAATSPELLAIIKRESVVIDWLKRNQIPVSRLTAQAPTRG